MFFQSDISIFYYLLSCFGFVLFLGATLYAFYIKFQQFVGRDRGQND